MSESAAVPAGYEIVATGLGFSDRLQPYYRRVAGDDVSFGFVVQEQHLNLMGICHGGALMTLADIAAATSLNRLRERPSPMPTISLNFDFQSPGKAGHWLHTRADTVTLRRRVGFCSGCILDGDTTVLRYSGVFYLTDRELGVSEVAARAMQALSGDGLPVD
jgi:uncharacterized protein (TIGR00369 family)